MAMIKKKPEEKNQLKGRKIYFDLVWGMCSFGCNGTMTWNVCKTELLILE